MTSHHRELDGVRDRYAKRAASDHRQLYTRFNAYANSSWQEREAGLVKMLKKMLIRTMSRG